MSPARANPIAGFTLTRDDFRFHGQGLQRPECILAEPDGTLWSADARGGVVRLAPDGTQELITQSSGPAGRTDGDAASGLLVGNLPNGLAFDRNGDLLIANYGTDRLERMTRHGHTTPMADRLDDGTPIGKTNFVCRDGKGRIWVTVSSMIQELQDSLTPWLRDGRVVLCTPDGRARLVADDVHFANECRLNAAETHLYVAQTGGRNIVRFPIEHDGSLGEREIVGPADHGRIIDGITFDAYGNLWGTYIFADGIFVVTPEGERHIVFDDSTPEEVDRLDDAFRAGELDLDFLLTTGGPIATWCASLTFGGPDLRTVYVGSLRQDRIASFRSPVAGLPLIHWAEHDRAEHREDGM
ncbi:SMP-30/gluconolactonase/LRE family protein [Pseudonocardia xishanensis]|uniref:SMP-30/Gluconolactonase/LRE-like region domain-containing protein n=1 Tax=Pseudonocardia xishanensis TaxID=630995 RepID=A0ABP8RGS7_9PSEU